jgi:hypothetical protein
MSVRRQAQLVAAIGLAVWMSFAAPSSAVEPDPAASGSRRAPVDLETLGELQFEGLEDTLTLRGRDARWQLLLAASDPRGLRHDLTRLAELSVEPVGVIEINEAGLIKPLGNGAATLAATLPNGRQARLALEVVDFDESAAVNFPNQIVPIFTKYGCNGGGCHGKAAGQNGFKLSLLGFEPKEDFEHLVIESRGRRLFPASPEKSLLVLKAINESPHGGGQRMEKDTHEYRLLLRWIAQGMPYGSEQDPVLTSIAITPTERMMTKGSEQQLAVVATYSDGSTEDITRTVQYESNNTDLAGVSATGLVSTKDRAGDVAVMARYQGQVAVFRASLPQGATIETWPEPVNYIDEQVVGKLKSLGIPASERSSDSEFLRRVTLDICGRLPTLEETREFLASSQPDKREQWIDRLLDSPDYADYFALKWSSILRNRRPSPGHQLGSFAFHRWIRDSLLENKPYDQFVRELMTASGSPETNPAVVWYREVNNVESRTEDAAQLFLGQRLQCARCHHHPFEKWAQDDYYHFAAFFNGVTRKDGATPEEAILVSRAGRPTMNNPKTGKPLPPAGLDAEPIPADWADDPRVALADWMTSRENTFFSRMLVNRYWKHFMARGMVEPEDDMRVTNPASNEQLMVALSENFAASGFDLKELVRTICRSATYQASANVNEHNVSDQTAYSRYYPKRLTAEVLLDALDAVAGAKTTFQGMPLGTRAVSLPDSGFSSYFLTVFGRPESTTACECERGQSANLAQSLHLLNSKEVQAKLADGAGRAALYATDAARPHKEKVEELYLVALSRVPTDDESSTAVAYLESKQEELKAGYEDLIWALINSKEFLFNH